MHKCIPYGLCGVATEGERLLRLQCSLVMTGAFPLFFVEEAAEPGEVFPVEDLKEGQQTP